MLCMERIFIMGFKKIQLKLIRVKNLSMGKNRKFVNFYCKNKLIKNKCSKKISLKNKKFRKRNKN